MSVLPYLPLWGFVALMVGTPGPANLVMMVAGARYGYVRLIPFLVGLISGKLALNLAIALGLATLLIQYPLATNILAIASASYMIFLVAQSWNSKPADTTKPKRFVFGYFAGLILHPLNPKAWTMGTLAATQFAIHYQHGLEKYILVPMSFAIAQLVFHSLWCLAGVALKRGVTEHIILNRALALLTIAVIIWAFFYTPST